MKSEAPAEKKAHGAHRVCDQNAGGQYVVKSGELRAEQEIYNGDRDGGNGEIGEKTARFAPGKFYVRPEFFYFIPMSQRYPKFIARFEHDGAHEERPGERRADQRGDLQRIGTGTVHTDVDDLSGDDEGSDAEPHAEDGGENIGGKEKFDEKIEKHDADDDADDSEYDHNVFLYGKAYCLFCTYNKYSAKRLKSQTKYSRLELKIKKKGEKRKISHSGRWYAIDKRGKNCYNHECPPEGAEGKPP